MTTPADLYCTHSDVYAYGLPRGLLANPGRVVSAVYPSTDLLELDGHGFGASGDRTAVLFRAEAGGSLPAEITAGTTVYAEAVSYSTFQIYAAASGGSPVGLSTAGSNVVVATPLPFDAVIEYYSRWADQFFPHGVPLEAPIPALVVGIVASLVAGKLLLISQQSSASMKDLELEAKAILERFGKGMPIRDAKATASTNLAITQPQPQGLPGGWVPAGGVIP